MVPSLFLCRSYLSFSLCVCACCHTNKVGCGRESASLSFISHLFAAIKPNICCANSHKRPTSMGNFQSNCIQCFTEFVTSKSMHSHCDAQLNHKHWVNATRSTFVKKKWHFFFDKDIYEHQNQLKVTLLLFFSKHCPREQKFKSKICIFVFCLSRFYCYQLMVVLVIMDRCK